MTQISDDLFLGNAPYGAPSPATSSEGVGGRGVGPMGRIFVFDVVPAALAANNIATSQAPGAAGNLTLTAGAGVTSSVNALGETVLVLDTPRNVRISSSGAESTSTFVVTGYDVYGQAMSEQIAGVDSPAIASGKKAFKSIKSVSIGAASVGNITVGTGDVLGLPFRVTDAGYLANVGWAGALARDAGTFVAAVTTDPATTTTGDVRGTYAPSSATNGSRRLVIGILLPAIASGPTATRAGALGVNQNLVT